MVGEQEVSKGLSWGQQSWARARMQTFCGSTSGGAHLGPSGCEEAQARQREWIEWRRAQSSLASDPASATCGGVSQRPSRVSDREREGDWNFISGPPDSDSPQGLDRQSIDGDGKSLDTKCRGIVLLVDDESMVLKVVSSVLRNEGYTVIAAASGEEALEIACREDQEIDLLLSDVAMPGMHGGELGRQIAELRPTICRLYMSGNLGSADLEEGAEVLDKPFLPSELLSFIENKLGS